MGIQVKATQVGYWGVIREVGDVFDVPNDYAFNPTDWFERTDGGASYTDLWVEAKELGLKFNGRPKLELLVSAIAEAKARAKAEAEAVQSPEEPQA